MWFIPPRPLLILIGLPAMVLFELWSCYRNYRRGGTTTRQMFSHVVVYVAVLAGALLLTKGVYHRAWEKLLPEPSPQRVTTGALKALPSLSLSIDSGLLLDPEGRMWGLVDRRRFGMLPTGPKSSPSIVSSKPVLLSVRNDWRVVTGSVGSGLAIDQAGALWAWGRNVMGHLGVGGKFEEGARPRRLEGFVRVGTETNWAAVAMGSSHSLGLKTDGTLWAWGYNSQGQLGVAGIRVATTPVQVGVDRDWVSIAASIVSSSLAVKKDGTLWRWGGYANLKWGEVPERVGTDTDWLAVMRDSWFGIAAIKRDGSPWAANTPEWLRPPPTSNLRDQWPGRLDFGFDPTAFSFDHFGALAIRKDSSLWQWNVQHDGLSRGEIKPTRVGHRTDWNIVAVRQGAYLGLTADGWLWSWGQPLFDPGSPTASRWLAYSQRPRRFFNVLTKEARIGSFSRGIPTKAATKVPAE